MMRTPDYWPRATRELAARDAVMRGLIDRFQGLALGSRGDAFSTLARSIVGQQISVKAAQSVWDRLDTRLGTVTPVSIHRAHRSRLRACGLSAQKAGYLKDLAGRFRNGTLEPARWHALDDERVIAELTSVKGIGRWTAEMFLIFYLMRPNVLPLDDVGLINGISQNYFSGDPVSRSDAREVAEAWKPWCSVATWYIWRSLDPLPVAY